MHPGTSTSWPSVCGHELVDEVGRPGGEASARIGGPQQADVAAAHDAKPRLGQNLQVPDRAAGKHEGFETQAVGAMHALGKFQIVPRLGGGDPIEVDVPPAVAADLVGDLGRDDAFDHVGRIPARSRPGT
jgi:hypothetical protein